MKNLIILVVSLLFLSKAFAYERAVGIALGNPSGINGQGRLGGNKWIGFTAGWEFAQATPDLIVNYLIKEKDDYYIQAYNMDLYYGGGLKLNEDLGAHGSIGTAHAIDGERLEVFANSGLTLFFLRRSGLELDLYGGVRYLF